MDVDELPQFDPNVDYNVILPIHQKRTLAFINSFITNTVSFLNAFAESCESRLLEFEYKLQKVEASLLILESQLASVTDINVGKTEESQPPKTIDEIQENLELPEISVESSVKETQEVREDGLKASKDPRFAKFFNMVQYGVPPQAVKLKMMAEGIDPDILENPNAIVPGYSVQPDDETASTDDND